MFSLAASALSRATRRSSTVLSSRFFHATGADLAKLNVEGLAEKVDLEGQNVLMRVDLNVPLSKEVSYINSLLFNEEERNAILPSSLQNLLSNLSCSFYLLMDSFIIN